MSLTSDLITYIGANSTAFETIEHAWTMQPLDDLPNNTPALLVFPGNEASKPGTAQTCVIQETIKEINIFMVCPVADLETLKDELNSVILGWQYTIRHEPLEHFKGMPQDIKGNHIWYLETFSTVYQRRSS